MERGVARLFGALALCPWLNRLFQTHACSQKGAGHALQQIQKMTVQKIQTHKTKKTNLKLLSFPDSFKRAVVFNNRSCVAAQGTKKPITKTPSRRGRGPGEASETTRRGRGCWRRSLRAGEEE